MSRINKKFHDLKRSKKKVFIAFITAGDPSLTMTEKLVPALANAGVDIIELGIPFSDPLADGPTIQAASQRALARGVTLKKILASVKRIRSKTEIPIALMTYYNPVFHYGLGKFVKDAKSAGVDGLIVPDLPPEEGKDFSRLAKGQGIATIFFLAPTTTRRRMKEIVKRSTGFVYYVSTTGVTGARRTLPPELLAGVRKAKRLTKKPICVGFGVSSADQVRAIAKVADGVIVGSAIVKEIDRHLGRKDLVKNVTRLVRKLSRPLC